MEVRTNARSDTPPVPWMRTVGVLVDVVEEVGVGDRRGRRAEYAVRPAQGRRDA